MVLLAGDRKRSDTVGVAKTVVPSLQRSMQRVSNESRTQTHDSPISHTQAHTSD